MDDLIGELYAVKRLAKLRDDREVYYSMIQCIKAAEEMVDYMGQCDKCREVVWHWDTRTCAKCWLEGFFSRTNPLATEQDGSDKQTTP